MAQVELKFLVTYDPDEDDDIHALGVTIEEEWNDNSISGLKLDYRGPA